MTLNDTEATSAKAKDIALCLQAVENRSGFSAAFVHLCAFIRHPFHYIRLTFRPRPLLRNQFEQNRCENAKYPG